MSLIELINLIAALLIGGFLTFLATQLVKQASWPGSAKLVLSLVMASLFGLATAWVNGGVWTIIHAWGALTGQEVLDFGTLIWTSATVWYKVVFRDTDWLKQLGAFPAKE